MSAMPVYSDTSAESGKSVASDQYLVFEVASQTLLCALTEVREILKPEPLTPVLGAAKWFMGIAAHQGRLLPVSDMGDCLYGQPSRNAPTNQWLAVHSGREMFALVVDNVIGVSDVVPDTIEGDTADTCVQSAGALSVLPGSTLTLQAEQVRLDGKLAYRVTLADLPNVDTFTDIRATA